MLPARYCPHCRMGTLDQNNLCVLCVVLIVQKAAGVDSQVPDALNGRVRAIQRERVGARSVLVGRPILWGLAANGVEGVSHVLELLRAELELAMVLAGHPTLDSIDSSLVKRIARKE